MSNLKEQHAKISFTVLAQHRVYSVVMASKTLADSEEGIRVPNGIALLRDRSFKNSQKRLKDWSENGLKHKEQKSQSCSIWVSDDQIALRCSLDHLFDDHDNKNFLQ